MMNDRDDSATGCLEQAGQDGPAPCCATEQQTVIKGLFVEKIPEDAAHWDSGDWIEWHRAANGSSPTARGALDPEPVAQHAALHVNLLRAAKSYAALTGEHLPVYRQIAHIYAAVYCDLPLQGMERTCDATGVEILHLAPDAPNTVVEVDLTRRFQTLIVVRIKDDFTVEARMIQRDALPPDCNGTVAVRWHSLPFKM